MSTRKEIVIIGPVGVGKTTTSKILSEKLGIPRVSMDDTLFKYMAEVGFDEDHWKSIMEKQGKSGAYRYLRVFGSHAVTRLLEDHKNCIFDFGGGGVMGEFPDEFARIKEALAKFENVVFLIPTVDKKESLQYIYERLNIQTQSWTILEHLVFHPSHDELAKHVVYIKDKTSEQVSEEILKVTSRATL
jgi:shikimate kinase